MKVSLVLAPVLQGAPFQAPFATITMDTLPLPNEGLIHNDTAYQILGRSFRVEGGMARCEYTLILKFVGKVTKGPPAPGDTTPVPVTERPIRKS